MRFPSGSPGAFGEADSVSWVEAELELHSAALVLLADYSRALVHVAEELGLVVAHEYLEGLQDVPVQVVADDGSEPLHVGLVVRADEDGLGVRRGELGRPSLRAAVGFVKDQQLASSQPAVASLTRVLQQEREAR